MRHYGHSSLVLGQVQNLGIDLTSGKLKMVQSDGSDLGSGDNSALLCMPSTTAGQSVILEANNANHFFEDVNGTSDITGQIWGVAGNVAWSESRPFMIYATYDSSNNIYFFITPQPNKIRTPFTAAEIGYHGNPSTNDADTDIFVLTSTDVTTTLQNRPVIKIGAFRMKKNTTAEEWEVQTIGAQYEGVGQFYNFQGNFFTMPTGQMGAASGTYLQDNGGTAPHFTTSNYGYTINLNGIVMLGLNLAGDGGTDGSGSVDTQISLPYFSSNNSATTEINGISRIEGAGGTAFYAALNQIGTNLSYFKILRTGVSGSNLVDSSDFVELKNSFFSAGSRSIITNFTYKAF